MENPALIGKQQRLAMRPTESEAQLKRVAACLSEELATLRGELRTVETTLEADIWAMRGIAIDMLPNHAWTLQGFTKCSPLRTPAPRSGPTGTA